MNKPNLNKPRMDAKHPRWHEFLEEIAVMVYRDENERKSGEYFKCDGTHRVTSQVLKNYNVDVKASLEYMTKHKSACTCFVLVNAVHEVDREYGEKKTKKSLNDERLALTALVERGVLVIENGRLAIPDTKYELGDGRKE